MTTLTIVTMPGDGIGQTVLPESLRLLDAAGFKANYVHADAERLQQGLITPAYDDDSPDIFEMRAQIDF